MTHRYDIFLSYPSADRAQVTELKAALEQLGLSVWLDAQRIDDAASIQRSIETGLARSRVLVAWYSKSYARSRPCQWELTAALIVAQAETLPTKRVLVLNPEPDTAHIVQTLVRDIELIAAPASVPMAALAQRLQVAAAQALGLLSDIRQLKCPPWYGQKKGLGSSRFVGRLSELWQLQNALTGGRFAIVSGQPSPGAALGLASVRGSGGMGKSLLAEEYALRFGAFWPGGIFWLDALGVSDRPEEESEVLAQRRASYHLEQLGIFAESLDIDSQGLSLGVLRARLGRHLQGGHPYLWLVDDLPSCTRHELDDWLAPSANGFTLTTSRSRQHDGVGTQVALGILQPDDAYALLCGACPPHNAAEEAAARRIVERLGGHAMAVDQARAACETQGFAGFLERLDLDDQSALALSKELAGELPNGHEQDIAKTFLGSINRLSPEAQALLTLAVQLSNAPMSSELITACKLAYDKLTNPGANAPDEQTERKTQLAAQDWAATRMKQLTNCSLADPGAVASITPDAPAVPAITVHTLIARVARWRLAEEGAATTATITAFWRQAAVRGLQQTLQIVTDIRQYAALTHDVQHARQLCEKIEARDQAALLGHIAQHDYVWGHYAQARAAWQIVLTYFENARGTEHADTLSSMNNLASTLVAIGDLSAARVIHEQVLAVRQRVLNPEHPATLTSMNNLANTLHAMGELPAARALQKQVQEGQQRTHGSEHPATLTSMNNLASTLSALGELPAAHALQKQVLALRQRVLGPEHPATLTSMNNLALSLNDMDERAGAISLQEQVLAIRQRIQGHEHPDTVGAFCNLLGILHEANDKASIQALAKQYPVTLAKLMAKLGHEIDQ
jgi:hypothetical protein